MIKINVRNMIENMVRIIVKKFIENMVKNQCSKI